MGKQKFTDKGPLTGKDLEEVILNNLIKKAGKEPQFKLSSDFDTKFFKKLEELKKSHGIGKDGTLIEKKDQPKNSLRR